MPGTDVGYHRCSADICLIILEAGVSGGRKDEDKNHVFFAIIREYCS